MKLTNYIKKNIKTLALILCLNCVHFTAKSAVGTDGGGGGFYGKYNGQWILLDDLEEGIIFNPQEKPYFSDVKNIIDKVEVLAPDFANDLKEPLSKKTWRLVPFELKCENPQSPLNIEQIAGACQDEIDIFVSESTTNLKPSDLTLHEIIQSVRLKYKEMNIPPTMVRKVKRLLTGNLSLSAEEFVFKLSQFGFPKYMTAQENKTWLKRLEEKRQREEYFKAHYNKLSERIYNAQSKDELNKACNELSDWRDEIPALTFKEDGLLLFLRKNCFQ